MKGRKNINWLKKLPEPYKSQAIENCKKDRPYSGDCINSSLWGALAGSFVWKETPHGGEYWKAVSNAIENNSFNPERISNEPAHT